MSEYVDVKARLQVAYLKHPLLNIVEELPEIITLGERIFIQCGVTVFRSPDDLLPTKAYCWEVFPGRTPFTKDSEQPNGATSALGRALGYMGFGIHTSIASADEVRTAQGNSHPSTDKLNPVKGIRPSDVTYITSRKDQPATTTGTDSDIRIKGTQHGPLPEWLYNACREQGIVEVYDNRDTVAGTRRPDFKCTTNGTGLWSPKPKKPAPVDNTDVEEPF